MPSATGETPAAVADPVSVLASAEAALLARRHAQRGHATLGDAHDAALFAALAALPAESAHAARACGQRLGGEVYARRFCEDHFDGAIATLSASLLESGAGALRLVDSFHRSGRVEHAPSGAASGWHAQVRAAAIEGVLEGFLASAFNCRVRAARAASETYQIELLEGRDVNQEARA